MKTPYWCLCILVCNFICAAQELTLSSVVLAPGEKGVIDIGFNSTGAAPLALQWEIELPAQFLASGAMPQPGEAAKKAGKAIACTGKWKKAPLSYSYRCLVVGGQQTITPGIVAAVPLTVPDGASGSKPVRITAAHMILQDSKKAPLKKVQGSITVR
jgi:hypothetical protein